MLKWFLSAVWLTVACLTTVQQLAAQVGVAPSQSAAAHPQFAEAPPEESQVVDLFYELDLEEPLKWHFENVASDIRWRLREARVWFKDLTSHGTRVTLRIVETAQITEAEVLIRSIAPDHVLLWDESRAVITLDDDTLNRFQRDLLRQTRTAARVLLQESDVEPEQVEIVGERCIAIRDFELKPRPRTSDDYHPSKVKLSFRLLESNVDPYGGRIPARLEVLLSRPLSAGEASERQVVGRRVIVPGDHVVDAEVVMALPRPIVVIHLDWFGERRLARQLDQQKGRYLAIVLNDEVIGTLPYPNPPSSRMIVRGDFTKSQAETLASMVRLGPYLSVPIEEVDVCPKD